MNNTQRVLLAVYLPLTLLFLVLDNLYPAHTIVSYVKYTTVISLFLASLAIGKTHTEQRFISFALFFVVIADFFSVFCSTIPQLSGKVDSLGMAGFMLAYLLLIIVYQKNFRFTKKEAVVFLVIIGIFALFFVKLAPHVTGLMYIGACLFGFVLCYMTWTLICTVFRGYFNHGAACLIALSAILIFISDLVVAYELFDPKIAGAFIPELKNIIWATYIPAWCLQVILIAEDNLIIPPYSSKRYQALYLKHHPTLLLKIIK